jgi:hypothetical protein
MHEVHREDAKMNSQERKEEKWLAFATLVFAFASLR